MSQSMRKPILTKFLCCFELRTGGLLIGLVDCLLYGAVILVSSLHLFFNIEFHDKKHAYEYNGFFQLVFLCVSFMISAVFLVGLKEDSSKKVYPYLILQGCQAFVFLFIELFILSYVLTILAAWRLYCFVCVYSIHRLLKARRKEKEEQFGDVNVTVVI